MSLLNMDDFHFSRMFRGDQANTSRQRHKHYLFSRLRLKPGMVVLDAGCGAGSAALELALFANVHVWGIDTSILKIQEATRKAQKWGVADRVSFVHVTQLESAHDYFDQGSFDAIYSIESLRHCSEPSQLYANLCCLLRPGGKFALYEWCWTDAFNPLDSDHVRLAELLEFSSGLGSRSSVDRTATAIATALRGANLSDVQYDDIANISSSASIPWYQVLDTALSSARTPWSDDSGNPGALGSLTKQAATVISQAGHLKLFTPMALLVGTRV